MNKHNKNVENKSSSVDSMEKPNIELENISIKSIILNDENLNKLKKGEIPNPKLWRNFVEKIIFQNKKKSRKINEKIDFLEYVSIDKYLCLISELNCLQLLLFDDLNKSLFVKFSDLVFFSGETLHENQEYSDLGVINYYNQSPLQREIFDKYKAFLDL